MKTPTTNVALGVYVSPEAVEAVLVRRSGDRYQPLERFVRPRHARAPEPAVTATPTVADRPVATESDYTLQIGGNWNPDAPSPTPTDDTQGDGASGARVPTGRPFTALLREILDACAAAGHRDVPVAFCLTAPEVVYLEVVAPTTKDGKGTDRKKVAARVRERAPQADPARMAIVPLAGPMPERVLAVAVGTPDPVTATLSGLGDDALDAARLDAEATLIASLVGRVHTSEGERTLVVRVGAEDTLVLFFDGARLAAVERLRSLSAYDRPETIVSRVLLQQDARKAGDPDTVYLAATEPAGPFLERLAATFPEAAVEPLGAAVAGLGVEVSDEDGAPSAGLLLAAAAAARELSGWDVTPDVRLLPSTLRRRRQASRAAWPTIAATALVVLVAAVGVLRYLAAGAEIDRLEEDLRVNPPVFPAENPDLLQMRVDSLNRAYVSYTRSLDVLDSLLVGSDEWTQAMRLIGRTTEATGGTWFTAWEPDGEMLSLSGRSLSRGQIISLSRRLGADLGGIQDADVGARQMYTFDMRIPRSREIPEAALYLRNVAATGSDEAAPRRDTEYVVDPGDHDH